MIPKVRRPAQHRRNEAHQVKRSRGRRRRRTPKSRTMSGKIQKAAKRGQQDCSEQVQGEFGHRDDALHERNGRERLPPQAPYCAQKIHRHCRIEHEDGKEDTRTSRRPLSSTAR